MTSMNSGSSSPTLGWPFPGRKLAVGDHNLVAVALPEGTATIKNRAEWAHLLAARLAWAARVLDQISPEAAAALVVDRLGTLAELDPSKGLRQVIVDLALSPGGYDAMAGADAHPPTGEVQPTPAAVETLLEGTLQSWVDDLTVAEE